MFKMKGYQIRYKTYGSSGAVPFYSFSEAVEFYIDKILDGFETEFHFF